MKQQEMVSALASEYGLSDDLMARYVDLSAEIGELGKEILNCTDYGKHSPVISDALRDELGDCLFSLLFVANIAGVDMDEALSQSIAKYRARWAAKGDIGSGGT